MVAGDSGRLGVSRTPVFGVARSARVPCVERGTSDVEAEHHPRVEGRERTGGASARPSGRPCRRTRPGGSTSTSSPPPSWPRSTAVLRLPCQTRRICTLSWKLDLHERDRPAGWRPATPAAPSRPARAGLLPRLAASEHRGGDGRDATRGDSGHERRRCSASPGTSRPLSMSRGKEPAMSKQNIIRAWKDENVPAEPQRGRAGGPAGEPGRPGRPRRAHRRRVGRDRRRLRVQTAGCTTCSGCLTK